MAERDSATIDDMLPIAEMHAMRLDGELMLLGDSATHVDRVVDVADRLRSLGVRLRRQHIVSGRAAAWVHGAMPLPRVIDVAVLRHRRADAPDGCSLHIRSVALHECVTHAGRTVTGRLRTVVDLLADEPFDDDVRTAIPLLVDDWAACTAAIARSGRAAPARMRERLEALRPR